jgi:hypothetical protein
MRSATHCCLFTLVVVLALVRSASAAEPGAVLVGGTASARQQIIASGAVATAVRAAGWIIDGKPYSAADAAAATACLRKPGPWSCIAEILRDQRIRRVAVVSVDPKPGKAGTTDTVISERLVLSNIDSLFVAQRFCGDLCTEDRLAGLATELTRELIDRVVVGSGQTVLAIKSTPRGARAYVDSNLVGGTDTSISVVPGAHTIAVELEDYRTDTRHVQVEENTTQEVSFTLQPSGSGGAHAPPFPGNDVAGGDPTGSARPPDITRRPRLVPGAIVGVGLAAFATGVVLFALDEDAVTKPDEEASSRYRDAATRGALLGVSGLAIAGVGGYLWWKYGQAGSAPAVAPVNGGAVIGLSRSF